VFRIIRQKGAIVFSMFTTQDKKKESQATILVREVADFISFVAELAKETFEGIGGTNQGMQSGIKVVKEKSSLHPPSKGMDRLRFERLPSRTERTEPRLGLGVGRRLVNGISVVKDLGTALVFGLLFAQGLTVVILYF